MNTKLSKCSY